MRREMQPSLFRREKDMELIFKAADKGKQYKVTKIYVKEGLAFEAGAPLFKAESGKLNTVVKAEQAGTLMELFVHEGQEIGAGDILARVSYEEAGEQAVQKQMGIKGISPDNRSGKDKGGKPSPAYTLPGKKETLTCDIAVIGAGPGGYEAAIYAAKQGKSVILIEKGKVGGTCLNAGCIPTKAIVSSAARYHGLQSSAIFGVSCPEVSFDMHQVISHKNQVVGELRQGIESLLKANDVRLVRGAASFQGEKELLVAQGLNRTTVKADHIIIASGSRILKLPIPGINGKNVLNSASALDLEEDFTSIAIIGGGVIGMEFAGIYAAFDKQVHVLEYEGQILPTVDSDLAGALLHVLEGKADIRTGVRVKEIRESENNRCIVVFEADGCEKYLVTDKVLVAVGRAADMEGLKLDNAGIRLTENGRAIEVDSHMQTNVDGIYAIGDVTGKIQLAHAASHQGMAAVDHILQKQHAMEYDFIPSVIFSTIELAAVGKTEGQLKKEGIPYRVSRFPFAANGKALTMEERDGFVKLLARETDGALLGAAVAGPDASNLISILALALSNHLPAEAIIRTVFPHPTLGEGIHEAALGLTVGAIHNYE